MTSVEQFYGKLKAEQRAWQDRQWVEAHRRLIQAVVQFVSERYQVDVSQTDEGLRVERAGHTVAALAVCGHRLMPKQTRLGSQQRTHIRQIAKRLRQIPAPVYLLIVADEFIKEHATNDLHSIGAVSVWSTKDLAIRLLPI